MPGVLFRQCYWETTSVTQLKCFRGEYVPNVSEWITLTSEKGTQDFRFYVFQFWSCSASRFTVFSEIKSRDSQTNAQWKHYCVKTCFITVLSPAEIPTCPVDSRPTSNPPEPKELSGTWADGAVVSNTLHLFCPVCWSPIIPLFLVMPYYCAVC